MKIKKLKKYPAIMFTIIIFILSSIEYKLPPGPPGTYRQVLLLMILHIGEFGLFSIFLMLGFYPYVKFYFLGMVSISYGILDEIHQYFVPTRYFDVVDIVCNIIGAILGIFVCLLIYKINKKRNKEI